MVFMKKHPMFKSILTLVVYICTALLVSSITWIVGWLGGWLLQFLVGAPVVDGLNVLFESICNHTFTRSDVPLVTATLATIGTFFKTTKGLVVNKGGDRE